MGGERSEDWTDIRVEGSWIQDSCSEVRMLWVPKKRDLNERLLFQDGNIKRAVESVELG